MDVFLAYSEQTDVDLLDIMLAISREGISPKTPDDLPKDGTGDAVSIGMLYSTNLIVVVWPRGDQWTPLTRAAVRIGQERNKLIVVAERGTQFPTLLTYHLSFVDEGPKFERLTRAVFKFAGRMAANRETGPGISAAFVSARRIAPDKAPPLKPRPRASTRQIVQLDVAILDQLGDPALDHRSQELTYFMEAWQRRTGFGPYPSTGRSEGSLMERYLERYGGVTPWTMIAITNQTAEEQLLDHLVNTYPAQALSGRFIIFVIDRDRGEARQKPLRHSLLRQHLYFDRVNGSPVQDELFEELATHTSRRALRTFSQWMTEYRAYQQPIEFEEQALAEMSAKSARGQFQFVSYNRRDAGQTAPIVVALEALGIPCWFDTKSVEGGEIWVRSAARGLRECAGVLPFCSIPFSRSTNCLREILFADRLKKPFRPTWLTDPALEDEMELLLGPYQAVNGSQDPPALIAEKLRQSIN